MRSAGWLWFGNSKQAVQNKIIIIIIAITKTALPLTVININPNNVLSGFGSVGGSQWWWGRQMVLCKRAPDQSTVGSGVNEIFSRVPLCRFDPMMPNF